MARIPIFDSEATEDSSENPIDHTLAADSWLTSIPVKITGGPGGDQRNVSFEFVLSGSPVAQDFNFEFYQAFWGDNPWINVVSSLPTGMRQVNVGAYPVERCFPGSGALYPWAREQVAIAGAAGRIDHYNITRYVTMNIGSEGSADCRWFPMLVHGMWMRLHIRTTSAAPYPRLRVFAHVGGLGDLGYYTERIANPYSWATPEA